MAANAKGAAPAAPLPTHALDKSAYTEVVIQKAGEYNGLAYRRGQRLNVDAATLTAFKELGLV